MPASKPLEPDNLQPSLRKLAVLLTSVDAVAAQHLMMQLPSDAAALIRGTIASGLACTLEEQQAILQEFQLAVSCHQQQDDCDVLERPWHAEPSADRWNSSSWETLSGQTILAAIRNERPPLIAVVISQLSTDKAISVLRELGRQTSSQVMRCLSQLTEMDSAVKSEIENYLSIVLGKHLHREENKSANAQRVSALLQAAPSELQSHWQSAVRPVVPPWDDEDRREHLTLAPSAKPAESSSGQHTPETMQQSAAAEHQPTNVDEDTAPEESNASPASADSFPLDSVDAESTIAFPDDLSLNAPELQQQFEAVAELPGGQLRELIENIDAETLLLSVAGASTTFIQKLRDKLQPQTVADMEDGIRKLGAIRLKDIDEAQLRLVACARDLSAIKTNADRRAA